eukprot:12860074-Prorocentrum_lima.AAC.1
MDPRSGERMCRKKKAGLWWRPPAELCLEKRRRGHGGHFSHSMDSPLHCWRFRGWLGVVDVPLLLQWTAWPPLTVHAARLAWQGCSDEQAMEPKCA